MSGLPITHSVTLYGVTVEVPSVPLGEKPEDGNTYYEIPAGFGVEVPLLDRSVRLWTERATVARLPSRCVEKWLVRVAEWATGEALACFDRGEETSGQAFVGLVAELLREAGDGQ